MFNRVRVLVVPAVAAVILGCLNSDAEARADVPIYTSPIDVTGLHLALQGSAPDRDTGEQKVVPLPGPPVALSDAMDFFWSGLVDGSGRTRRQQTCDFVKQSLDQALAGASGFAIYDYQCNLAPSGQLLYTSNAGWSNEYKPGPSTLGLAYTLAGSWIEFFLRTPGGYTCDRHTDAPFCINDPGARVDFTPQLLVSLRAPKGPCSLAASDGKVVIQGTPRLDTRGLADVLAAGDDLLLDGFYQNMLLQQMAQATTTVDLPLDDVAAQVRNSAECQPGRQLSAFTSEMETVIEPAQGAIFLRFGHPAIAPPRSMNTVSGGGPVVPDFAGPLLTSPPVAAAGAAIKVAGRFFPETKDPTVLNLVFEHDGICQGGKLELDWGPAGGGTHVDTIPITEFDCTTRHPLTNLTPATGYQFRARDCDDVTCSPWTAPFTLTTLPDNGPTKVDLTLDGSVLNSLSANADGTFDADVTIPAATAAGTHTLRAAVGDLGSQNKIDITSAAGAGKATIMLTAAMYGEKGCPMRPLPNAEVTVEAPFSAFGTGFAAGPVSLHLDSATGKDLGAATARADGTFCGDTFQGLTYDDIGGHTLVAVQDGQSRATLPTKMFRPRKLN
jgi:hypothetical protein